MQIDSSRSSKTREKTIAALSPSQTGQESEPPSVAGADSYQPCLGSAVPLPVAAAHERTGIFLACASTKGHFLTRGIAARLVRDLSEAPSRLSGSCGAASAATTSSHWTTRRFPSRRRMHLGTVYCKGSRATSHRPGIRISV